MPWAVFVTKPTTSWEDPLSLRILTILPYCYRCWAKLRLRHLGPWIQSWATEDMFAVKAGKGADAAWYRSAVLREEALMMAKPFSGACDDIWKAYDGVSRETAIVAAMAAGFPRGPTCPTTATSRSAIAWPLASGPLGSVHWASRRVVLGATCCWEGSSDRCSFACAPPVSPRGSWRMTWRPWLLVLGMTPG